MSGTWVESAGILKTSADERSAALGFLMLSAVLLLFAFLSLGRALGWLPPKPEDDDDSPAAPEVTGHVATGATETPDRARSAHGASIAGAATAHARRGRGGRHLAPKKSAGSSHHEV